MAQVSERSNQIEKVRLVYAPYIPVRLMYEKI